MRYSAITTLTMLLALGISAPSQGAANREIEAANAQYRQGNFQEALDTYVQMATERPEDATLQFNRGAALFQLGKIDEARASFEEARALSDDPALQAASAYNLGNCAFRSGEAQLAQDPEKAIADLHRSVGHYRDALTRNGDYGDAAHNLEMARRVIKQLEEQVQQQEQEQQHQQDELKQKLDELVEEQEQQESQSQEAAERQQDPSQPDPGKQEMDQLSQQQRDTREKTEELSEEMGAKRDESGSPMEDAEQHTKAAAEKQREAEEHLKNQEAEQAKEAQEEALEELKKARDALGDGDESEEEQAKNDTGNGEREESRDSDASQQDGDQDGQDGMEALPPPDATAQDILEQEQENKRMRNLEKMILIRPVDKDW